MSGKAGEIIMIIGDKCLTKSRTLTAKERTIALHFATEMAILASPCEIVTTNT
jgi:hypothetical protein